MHSLLINYRLRPGTEVEHAELRESLTPALSSVPELLSLSWLSNGAVGHHGGFFVFERKPAFDAFGSSEPCELFRSQWVICGRQADDLSVDHFPKAPSRPVIRIEEE
jgi:hypothetical protein